MYITLTGVKMEECICFSGCCGGSCPDISLLSSGIEVSPLEFMTEEEICEILFIDFYGGDDLR